MDGEVNTWIQLFLRWIHVVAGVIWIGHLYFFNWVNAHFAKLLDGPTKKTVIPELMPRALFWFRWGAAWTWITGMLLAGMVYYMGGVLFDDQTQGDTLAFSSPAMDPTIWFGIVLALLAVGVVLYNTVMKAVKNIVVANTILLVLLAAVYLFLEHVGHFGGRALYIHVGAIFGTIMAFNVWMVIWPSQRKIITAIKEGTAPDADTVALAGLRSRHNTFMSVPLIYTMISNHYSTVYGHPLRDVCLAIIIAIGFLAVRMLYGKSAKVTGF